MIMENHNNHAERLRAIFQQLDSHDVDFYRELPGPENKFTFRSSGNYGSFEFTFSDDSHLTYVRLPRNLDIKSAVKRGQHAVAVNALYERVLTDTEEPLTEPEISYLAKFADSLKDKVRVK